MSTANLNTAKKEVITGNDNIVIVNHIDGLRGGRTLDVTGFASDVIHAGHLIIKTKEGDYAPMPVKAGGIDYAPLPAGATYVGYLAASILKEKPFASIMVRGTVNPKATPFDMSPILGDVKAALPLIDYQED